MARIVVRPRRPEDAADLHEVFLQPRCIWGTLQLPSKSLEEVRRMFEQDDIRRHGFVAEVDGKVVADAGLYQGEGREAHVARLGMMVHDAHQGQGIGSRLMEALLELGDSWLGVRRYELEVYEDNEKAIALYRKFGFEVEGCQTADTFRDGRFVNSLVMARLVGGGSDTWRGEAAGVKRLPGDHGDMNSGGIACGFSGFTGDGEGSGSSAAFFVRPARADDAENLRSLHTDPRVLRYTLYLPDETVASIRTRLVAPESARHWFVVEHGGAVVGEVMLIQASRRRAHMGSVSLGVAGHGRSVLATGESVREGARGSDASIAGEDAFAATVTRAALQAVIDLADRWLNLKRLECRLYADDHVGRAVVEALGFRQEVVFREAAFREGRYEDMVGFGRVRA